MVLAIRAALCPFMARAALQLHPNVPAIGPSVTGSGGVRLVGIATGQTWVVTLSYDARRWVSTWPFAVSLAAARREDTCSSDTCLAGDVFGHTHHETAPCLRWPLPAMTRPNGLVSLLWLE